MRLTRINKIYAAYISRNNSDLPKRNRLARYGFTISILLICSAVHIQAQTINLVSEQKSRHTIIIAEKSSHWDSLAACELQRYIKEISGAEIQIKNDNQPVSEYEIIIGLNKHSNNFDTKSITDDDGYIIKTEGDRIYFTGRSGRGSLNAVYTFLEKFLNCHMYSSKVKIILHSNSVTLPQIRITENPVFNYRDILYYETYNEEYCLWHKLTTPQDKKMWGMYVHTFQSLLPPEKYFAEHPEYYALRNDIRVPEEPCLSNPEVFRIMVEELKRRMKENPEADIWSVSQNDNFSNCQCPDCKRLDEFEGSASGSVLNFVNKVAREFPDKTISTLAYQYSRKAPRTIKPEKNVNIMLCSIECFRTKPLAADTSNNSFTHDLIEWTKLTNNIFVWDYVVQFTNYVSPFPNLHVLQPNIQLFAKHGARMMFQQGANNCEGGEFSQLKTYLIAKLLWNPQINIDSVMNNFLMGYYGDAGEHIKTYIDLMQKELIKWNTDLWIYSNPVLSMKDYLSANLVEEYNRIFDEAEKAVSNNAEYLQRVKFARLPLQYAMLEQAKTLGAEKNGTVIKDDNGCYKTNSFIANLLDRFSAESKKLSTIFINEKGLSVDTYISRYKAMLSKTMKNPVALLKPVKYISIPSSKYPANGEMTLTDGLHGDEDHHFNWQGFEGEDMEVVLDFQQPTIIKKVSIDFLQIILSWIFLPQQVEIKISDDGNNFKYISAIKNSVPLNRDGAFIQNFSLEFDPVKTRFLKLTASSIKTCPRWHTGYPDKAWLFTDEIVVE